MKAHKVWGIGFQKTGTTTLGTILDKLGYRVAGYHEFRPLVWSKEVQWSELEKLALSVAREVDAAKDTPWPLLYRQLDENFPQSKFIHITRDPEAWIKSAVNDFKDKPNPVHQLIYGSPFPMGNEAEWLARYERHNAEVLEYFRDRPDDFLSMRLEDGVSFEKVCNFLDEPLVAHGSPQANTRLKKKIKMALWKLTGRR